MGDCVALDVRNGAILNYGVMSAKRKSLLLASQFKYSHCLHQINSEGGTVYLSIGHLI